MRTRFVHFKNDHCFFPEIEISLSLSVDEKNGKGSGIFGIEIR